MSDVLNLGGLFICALLAATIFPAQSEMMLIGLYLTGNYNTALLVLVAVIGNVLGSCINWLLGKHLTHFQSRKWFFINEARLANATHIYQRFGVWTLLFAWIPIIGDPLTVIAGFLRVHIIPFVILVTIGKAGRYIAIIMAL